MTKEIKNDLPVAVVTGANGGIGLAVVKNLIINGYFVVACTKSNSKRLEKFKSESEISDRIFIEICDITNSEQVKNTIKKIFSLFKRVDILVNSAGIPHGKLFLMSQKEDLHNVFETNFFSLLIFTQSIARIMGRNKNGSIVNISSISAFRHDEGTLAYGASKAALNFATSVLAKELAHQGIRVNAIAPGVTNTPMLKSMEKNAINKQIDESALKKIATPSEIASSVYFLCKESSSHITGQVIKVDGGQL